MYTIYILKCGDGSLYTGITNDLKSRVKVHEAGKGSKYVKTRLPIKVVYTEEVADRSLALKREFEIKNLDRKAKLKLVS